MHPGAPCYFARNFRSMLWQWHQNGAAILQITRISQLKIIAHERIFRTRPHTEVERSASVWAAGRCPTIASRLALFSGLVVPLESFCGPQVYGAVTLNNTLCLGLFLLVVHYRQLEWVYTSEVLVTVGATTMQLQR
jgi:hypothetical protein